MTEERFNEIIEEIYYNKSGQGIEPAKEILEYIKGLEKQVSIDNSIYECLRELCQLKTYKDEIGKDSFYKKKQPKLWEQANRLL